MVFSVRINGTLAQEIGTTRLRVAVEQPATVADLLGKLRVEYPDSAEKITQTIPFVAGRHLDPSAPLSAGQEIALLMPAAGG